MMRRVSKKRAKRLPAEAFHPGEYVADEIAARGWSLETLCEKSGLHRDFLAAFLRLKNRNAPMAITEEEVSRYEPKGRG